MDTKKRRGGRREGAGRPKGDGRVCSFRLPGRMANRLDEMEDRSGFVRSAIETALDTASLEQNREKLPSSAQNTLTSSADRASLTLSPVPNRSKVSLPFFDIRVVAGFPVPLDNDERSQDIDLLQLLCPHPEASYLIRVNGDSMIDAGIYSGDIVIVDKSCRTPGPKEIAMCELNGEYTLKRFETDGDGGWLVPANPDFPRIRVSPEDEFSVWGIVTYIIHKARD